MKSAGRYASALPQLTGPPPLKRNRWTRGIKLCYCLLCATPFPRSCGAGQSVSEAPDSTELATTQLLPYLAAGGNEEQWRSFRCGGVKR